MPNPNIRVPRFKNEAEAQAAYVAFGKIAVYWGPVEIGFESILLSLRHWRGHPQMGPVSVDFPVSFSKKTREIRDLLKADSRWTELREKVSAMIHEANTLHDIRTLVVHGCCEGSNIDGNIAFSVSAQKEGVLARPKQISLDRLNDSAERMAALASKMGPLWHDIEARARP